MKFDLISKNRICIWYQSSFYFILSNTEIQNQNQFIEIMSQSTDLSNFQNPISEIQFSIISLICVSYLFDDRYLFIYFIYLLFY
jgi:hypothetical protein